MELKNLDGESVGCKHRVGPAHLLAKAHLWACLLKPTKSALWFNAKLSMHEKAWLLLMRSDAKPFLGQWLKRVRHAETEKNKRKKTKAIRPWLESCSKRAIRLSWEKNNWELQLEEAQSVWKIVRNTVRVWESENKKKRYFFYSSYM